MNLALFDFCGTLVDFQTANAYVRYVLAQRGQTRSVIENVRLFLNKTGFVKKYNYILPKMAINKTLLLYQLKGIPYVELDKMAKAYYQNSVKPRIISQSVERLIMHLKAGDDVALVSAGYDIYLKYFLEDYEINTGIMTNLEFKNGIFTGRIIGRDNFGEQKVKNLCNRFTEKDIQKYGEIVGYTDSDSDIPLLNYCTKKIYISPKEALDLRMEEIVDEIIYY